METLVKINAKRIKCYNCYNYLIIHKLNENSFSGVCKCCGKHIYIVKRSKETLIRIAGK